MQPSGIHLLLTYKCNARCGHCFLSCGPERGGMIPVEDMRKYVDDAIKAKYINHFYIEGGEPFLYPRLLEQSVAAIEGAGYWLGVLTNGFWASSDEKARAVLGPLAAAGLDSIGISTDAWHERFVPIEYAERAVRIAGEVGIEADLMVCAGGQGGGAVMEKLRQDGFDAYASQVKCRGRASASAECQLGKHDWESLTQCSASFGGRSRVHIGPEGQIHLCQGLLMGIDARTEPLPDIFTGFDSSQHPLCNALAKGGPAALARLAMEQGFTPRQRYADGCQLCYEARRSLLGYFPHLVGPAGMYDAPLEESPPEVPFPEEKLPEACS